VESGILNAALWWELRLTFLDKELRLPKVITVLRRMEELLGLHVAQKKFW
jgi:hypothetical protein